MHVVSFQSKKKILQRFLDILIASKGALALGMLFIYISKLKLTRSLKKRRMSLAQTITTERTAEKCLDKRQTTPQTQARQPNKQSAGRRSLSKLQKAV